MERHELSKSIGANIRKYRLKRDLSQESLALTSGFHPAYIGRLERGEKCPTIDTLYKLSDALKISVWELISFDENVNSNKEIINRIELALRKVPEEKQLQIAEIIELIVKTIE